MAKVQSIGEAVRNMSVHMANMYYYLTKAVIEDFGPEAKKSFERAIIEFGHARGKKIAEAEPPLLPPFQEAGTSFTGHPGVRRLSSGSSAALLPSSSSGTCTICPAQSGSSSG